MKFVKLIILAAGVICAGCSATGNVDGSPKPPVAADLGKHLRHSHGMEHRAGYDGGDIGKFECK